MLATITPTQAAPQQRAAEGADAKSAANKPGREQDHPSADARHTSGEDATDQAGDETAKRAAETAPPSNTREVKTPTDFESILMTEKPTESTDALISPAMTSSPIVAARKAPPLTPIAASQEPTTAAFNADIPDKTTHSPGSLINAKATQIVPVEGPKTGVQGMERSPTPTPPPLQTTSPLQETSQTAESSKTASIQTQATPLANEGPKGLSNPQAITGGTNAQAVKDAQAPTAPFAANRSNETNSTGLIGQPSSPQTKNRALKLTADSIPMGDTSSKGTDTRLNASEPAAAAQNARVSATIRQTEDAIAQATNFQAPSKAIEKSVLAAEDKAVVPLSKETDRPDIRPITLSQSAPAQAAAIPPMALSAAVSQIKISSMSDSDAKSILTPTEGLAPLRGDASTQLGAAPLPPSAPPLRDAQAMVAQIIAAATARSSGDRIELRLDPPELGRVSLTFTLRDDGVIASLSAERGDTETLLRRHGEDLQRALREAGFGDVSLDFSSHRDGEMAEDDFQENEASVLDHSDAEPRQSTVRSAASGMDIRV